MTILTSALHEPLVWSSGFSRSGPPEGGTPNGGSDLPLRFMATIRVRSPEVFPLHELGARTAMSARCLADEPDTRTKLSALQSSWFMASIHIRNSLALQVHQTAWVEIPGWTISLFIFLVALLTDGMAADESFPLPPAEEVIARLLARAKAIGSETNRTRYVYVKTLETEELDDSGRVKSRKEQVYEVKLIGGMPHPRLIRVNGLSLNKEQINTENANQEKTRRTIDSQRRSGRREMVLNEDLLNRFQYKVEGRDTFLGRPALIVSFKPKPIRLPEKRIADRVINKLSGRFWIDEQESELAKIDLRLTEEVTLWGGVLGSLKELTMVMDRDRVQTGVWFNKKGLFTIQGRKLFTSLRMRARETASKIRLDRASE